MTQPIDRRLWCAMLAKMTAPMDAERAAAALAAMLPLLRSYPDAMFREDSAVAVAQTARVLGDGEYGPIGRVPTYGELESALCRWWRNGPGWQPTVTHEPVKALAAPQPDGEAMEAAREAVAEMVRKFSAERSFHQPATATGQRTQVAAHQFSREQLIRTYERLARDGDACAATRLAMLRRHDDHPAIDWSM